MNDIDAADKAQVGVSTLIVFIAMILIASISAGVLINTTTSLESQSEETGQATNDQVTTRVQVVGVAGNVTGQGTVDWVNLTIKSGAGSGNVDLSAVVIQYVGPDGAEVLVHTAGSPAGGEFVTEPLRDSDGSVPVLNEPEDRASIAIDLGQSNAQIAPLGAQDRAKIKLSTASGGSTRIRIGPPGELEGETVVTL